MFSRRGAIRRNTRLLYALVALVPTSVLATNVKTTFPLHADQQVRIAGKVVGTNGQSISGATVTIKGSAMSVATDQSGSFEMNLPTGNETLIVSFVGYKTKEVAVAGQREIAISLEPASDHLDEVVVIGYGTVRQRDLTGSVVSVKPEDIVANPVVNVMESLQGKIAGVDINRGSGAVGTNPNVLLRGTRSIYGDNSPLYIVDGVPASYDQINPSDIASIDVLKDASSTAIYGSAGANGVVIITTKKGQEGVSKVDFDSYYGFSGTPHFFKGMIGEEYITYLRERYRTINGQYPEDISNLLNVESLDAYNNNKWIDWIDEITNNSSTQEKYNLSFSTGVRKTKVYASFTYSKEGGMLTNENQGRAGARLNLDHEVAKWLKVGTNLNVNYTNRNARGNNIFTRSLAAYPLGEVYDQYGNVNIEYIAGETTPLGDQLPDQYANNTKSTFSNLNAYVELTPFAGLTLRSNVGATLNNSRNGTYIGRNASSNVASGYAAPLASIYNNYGYSYIWENILTYNRRINDAHDLTLTGITSWADNRGDNNNLLGQGQELDYYLFYNIGNGTEKQGIASAYEQKQRLSFAGRLNYSYLGKYLLTLTNRWDGVSHLAEGHKWSAFPAAAVAWRVSDEEFMSFSRSFLDDLKIRFGYGVTGNAGGMSAYASKTQAYTYQAVSLDGQVVPHVQNFGTYSNPTITWERSHNRNIGVDLSLFNNRIGLAFESYNTDTKGLLFRRTLPITSAITAWGSPLSTWQNIGETNNRGIELSLRTVNIRNSQFEWESSFSFTKNKEKIVSLPDGDVVAQKLFEGEPINVHYDYKYLGILSDAEDEEDAKFVSKQGGVKVATNEKFDADGVSDNGVHPYTDTDRVILGTTNPNWLLGVNNTFKYKGFDMNVFTMIRWGQMIHSNLMGWYTTGDGGQPKGINYWTPENQGAYYPRPGISSTTGISALRYVDGSFLKIKTITLGYSLPQRALEKVFTKRARIYATAYNPLVFTKEKALKGTDPETNGSDTFPLFASYVIGVNFSF